MAIDKKSSALVIVDLQNDFCTGGALAVQGGEHVAQPINSLLPQFDHVVLTQDWHPKGHVSFASSWPGRHPYETVEADGIPQILWPDHCVQGSEGAAFHSSLEAGQATLVLRKGNHPRLDSYSRFFENDRKTPTGLDGWLRNIGVSELYLAGLATDFCVLYSALDALGLGYAVRVFEDAVKGVDVPPGGVARALTTMRRKGAIFLRSGDLL